MVARRPAQQRGGSGLQPSAASVAPLDAAELAAWRAFAETVTDLIAAIESDLAPCGLTLGDYQVLVFLSESADGTMRMVDLASCLQLTPSGLTRRLDGLVKRALVTRRPAVDDRRVMLAAITAAGRSALDEAYPVHVASVRARLVDHLEPDDVAALGRIFTRVRIGLRGDGRIGNASPS